MERKLLHASKRKIMKNTSSALGPDMSHWSIYPISASIDDAKGVIALQAIVKRRVGSKGDMIFVRFMHAVFSLPS